MAKRGWGKEGRVTEQHGERKGNRRISIPSHFASLTLPVAQALPLLVAQGDDQQFAKDPDTSICLKSASGVNSQDFDFSLPTS